MTRAFVWFVLLLASDSPVRIQQEENRLSSKPSGSFSGMSASMDAAAGEEPEVFGVSEASFQLTFRFTMYTLYMD